MTLRRGQLLAPRLIDFHFLLDDLTRQSDDQIHARALTALAEIVAFGMRPMLRPTPFHFLLALYAGWVNQHQLVVIEYLRAENAVLREHIQRKRIDFTDAQRQRLARAAHRAGRAALDTFATLATPDTLLRWYREVVARKYGGSALRRTGRPPIATELRQHILAIATDNPAWGFSRIAGALAALGCSVSRSTIRRILLAAGMPPDARRSPGMTGAHESTSIAGVCGTAIQTGTAGQVTLPLSRVLGGPQPQRSSYRPASLASQCWLT